jgi:hypothetical protein
MALCVLLISHSGLCIASTASDQKLDRMENKIDTLVQESHVRQSIDIAQPLADRKHGVELNLFRILAWENDSRSFSATYSYFDTRRNVEWAIPVFYQWSDDEESYEGEAFTSSTANIDLHYRRYLGHRLDGLYLSGFSRITRVAGLEEEDGETQSSEVKFGIGVGVGWRKISHNGLYWGTSLSFGRYLTGESDIYESPDHNVGASIDDAEYIIDVEFLKFGYSF